LEVSPFLDMTLIFQYSSQSLLFKETIDKCYVQVAGMYAF